MYNPILCNVIFVLCSAIFSVIAVVAAYQHAVCEKYKFFSYGDSMLIITQ